MTALAAIWFAAHDLPLPEPEHVFAPPRKWRLDWAWIPQMVALEIEGGIWTNGRHTRGKGFTADLEKYNRAVLLGWRLFRCTPQQLADGDIMPILKQALESTP